MILIGDYSTVEPVLKDHTWYGLPRQVVSGGRSNYSEIQGLLNKLVVLQDRFSLMAVVSQDRFCCGEIWYVWVILWSYRSD